MRKPACKNLTRRCLKMIRSKVDRQQAKHDRKDDIAQQIDRISEENQRLFQQLLDGERRFRGLARAVWRVQEDERRKLARELHDSIGQTLVGLIHQLERVEKHVNGERGLGLLQDVQGLARNALDETRELSRLLRPPVLDDLGLEAALRWLARTLRERTGLVVSVECDLPARALDDSLETLVFRVVQEALNNVVKHAQGAPVTVQLEARSEKLSIRVSDQGPGFDVENVLGGDTPENSAGLRGIQERVRLFGGAFKIRSAPGQGTRLEILLPVELV